jgi:hypothetical protein
VARTSGACEYRHQRAKYLWPGSPLPSLGRIASRSSSATAHTPASAATDSHWAGPRSGTMTAAAHPAENAVKPIPTMVSSAADLASARALWVDGCSGPETCRGSARAPRTSPEPAPSLRSAGPAGKDLPVGQGSRVFGALDPLADWEQFREQVRGRRPVP